MRRPDSSGPRHAARRRAVTGQLHRLSRRPIEGRPSAFRFGRLRERDSVEKSARQRCMSQPLGYRRPSAMAGRNRRLSIDGSGGPTDTRYRRLERSAPGGRCRRNSVPHPAQGSRHCLLEPANDLQCAFSYSDACRVNSDASNVSVRTF